MNMFAKFDEIPSMILQDVKETKRYGSTDGRSFVWTVVRSDRRSDEQRENSIPSHKHSLRGYNNYMKEILKENIKCIPMSSMSFFNETKT